ncbi:hypothetical protein [Methanolobus sp.]|nr:hypothetical protein [Methanolobus sp.]
MNLALLMAMGAARTQIAALSDDDFLLLAANMKEYFGEESKRRGLVL